MFRDIQLHICLSNVVARLSVNIPRGRVERGSASRPHQSRARNTRNKSPDMSPQPLAWNCQSVLQLLQLYRRHQLLWDTASADYRNRTKKNEAWEALAAGMGLTRRDVEMKVHSLRSQFIRERKKVSSSGARSHWFAFEPMSFLNQVRHHRLPVVNELIKSCTFAVTAR